jgi:hypothetical protein
MEIGASIFFTDYSMAPTELAVALEERASTRCEWPSIRTSRSPAASPTRWEKRCPPDPQMGDRRGDPGRRSRFSVRKSD